MNTDGLAVALFCFNRPTHTRSTLRALAACPEASKTTLHVFIDGPRCADEKPLVDEVSELFQDLPFPTVRVSRSPVNKGLFRSITEGVSRILSEREDVIVLEDDLVVSPDFLTYMGDGLDRFRHVPSVGSIHGYALPVAELPDYYFLKGGDCWGWATWRDRWELFCSDPMRLLRQIVHSDSINDFMDTQGAGSLRMLCRRAEQQNQSWAILWHASLWLAGRLTLHPGQSFVMNVGVDGSGTHCGPGARFDVDITSRYRGLPSLVPQHDASAAELASAFLDDVYPATLIRDCLKHWKRWQSTLHARRLVRREQASA